MKKYTRYYFPIILKVLRISFQFIFLLLISTQVLMADNSSGQTLNEVRIDLKVKNKSLKDVLSYLEKKSGYRFVYNTQSIASYTNISFTASDKPLVTVLNEIFSNTKLSYLEQNNKIIVFEKDEQTEILKETSIGNVIQDMVVRGKVVSRAGEPLAGVSIKVKNGSTGGSTNSQGQYSISLNDGSQTLLFSYLGFETQEVLVRNRTTVDVTMIENIKNLEEVVVIGYGTQRRADVTSAVTTVKAENFVKGPVQDAGQLLQGKVAGLSVGSPSGNPTGSTQILLRGNTTLFGANSNPLVLIDGIPGDLKTVAPEDIESIDVLKDGSAAAIYGVRGSNGVIIITTKRAKGIFTNNVDYSGYTSTQVIANKLDLLTAQDYRDQIAAGTRGAEWDSGNNTDWLKEVTRQPLSQVHNLTIRGGNSTTNYLASGNYRALQGIFRKSDNTTFTGRIDVNHSIWNDKLKFNIGILNQTNNYLRNYNGNSFRGDSFNGWIYRQTVIRNPTEAVYKEDGDFYENVGNFDYENPMALLYESDGESKNVNSRMNGTITYRPISDLKVSALFSYSRYNSNNGYSETKKHISTIKSSLNGFASVGSDLSIDRLAELTAEYSKSIKDHRFVLLGGYGYQENLSTSMYSQNQDFPSDLFGYNNIGLGEGIKDSKAVISSNKSETNLISFFGRVNYSYKDKYLLLASLRHEGASQLYGSNSPWGSFWAVSGGWRVTNENFMKNQTLFDDIKLRAGYGITGNPPLAGFLSQPLLGYGNYVYSNGKWIRILGPATNANPFIRWEEKHEANIGLDFSILRGRISGNIDVYNRQIKDLLYNYQVPSPPNLYNETQANVGKMENKGLEVMLNFVPVKKKDFIWNTSFNFSTNTNKLVSLSNDLYQTTTNYFTTGFAGIPIQTFTNIVFIGKSIGDFYGYKVIDIDDNGKWIYEGRDGEPVAYDQLAHSFEDKKVIGNGLPKYYAGWNNNFSYKAFDLSITMRGAFDYQIINSQRMYMENPAVENYNILKSAYEPVFGKTVLDVPALEFNSYYVENGDFWKVDNITLGYNFNNIKSNYIKGARIYVSSLNTLTITKYSGLDPEVNRIGLNPGLDDRDKYPTTRTFTLGVNLNF
ncbi:SusC/RagA family TonB-linked outer membrane protein [Arcticibacter eurypsychrophilus]|uniref:SusC/RagA family TonB-linked outer membrane protein n=1 Tax=Arcticibacter eurypsychrophilus TaxID=1434752 RepID=UPI00084DAC4E|nr:SusC/RagA family TonB-linked outer membrane protein [Arcticibacter eurypsychrophilus]